MNPSGEAGERYRTCRAGGRGACRDCPQRDPEAGECGGLDAFSGKNLACRVDGRGACRDCPRRDPEAGGRGAIAGYGGTVPGFLRVDKRTRCRRAGLLARKPASGGWIWLTPSAHRVLFSGARDVRVRVSESARRSRSLPRASDCRARLDLRMGAGRGRGTRLSWWVGLHAGDFSHL